MFRKPKHVTILKHQRNATVYLDGRYLHVDMKISTRSKTGRQIARETAQTILAEVGASESAMRVIQDAPTPPDSFTREEGAVAVRSAGHAEEQRPAGI